MNYKQENYPACDYPNLMHRDYGRGVVLYQHAGRDQPDGDLITDTPYWVYNFRSDNWEFPGTDRDLVGQFATLSDAEDAVATLTT